MLDTRANHVGRREHEGLSFLPFSVIPVVGRGANFYWFDLEARLLSSQHWIMTNCSDQAPVTSSRTCFSAERLAARTATADFIAFSPPPRIALPVLTAAQNSAISFL